MRSIARKYFSPAFIVFIPALAWAGNQDELVQEWLERMQHAAHMVSYDGTFVYSQGDQLSAMRIIHKADQAGERERLISLDNTHREVIREKDRVTCILPDRKAVVVEKGRPVKKFPPSFPMQIEALKAYYHFVLGAQERVAGQTTQKIIIDPRDAYRYGHHLWVDTETGLLLQSHLLDEYGKRVEQFMFTQIAYLDEVPDSLLQPENLGEAYTWYEDSNKPERTAKQKGDAWYVEKLPPGFHMDMQRKHKMPTNVMPMEQLVYTDGLASISVFIEPHAEDDANLLGGSRIGAVNAHGRHFENFHVTAVGEVPQITVRMVCESIRRKEGEHD